MFVAKSNRARPSHGAARRIQTSVSMYSGALLVVALLSPLAFEAHAASTALDADLFLTTPTGVGAKVGTVKVASGSDGAIFSVDVSGLPPGEHGFHIHDQGSCAPGVVNNSVVPGGGAGGHYDPGHTGYHQGPDGGGHAGDLPHLVIDQSGRETSQFVLASMRNVAELSGRAVVIHAGGDNYSDNPKTLGGGGARIACGVLR